MLTRHPNTELQAHYDRNADATGHDPTCRRRIVPTMSSGSRALDPDRCARCSHLHDPEGRPTMTHDAAANHGTTEHYTIGCYLTGDCAEADTAEAALVAADQLARDYADAKPGRSLKAAREQLAIHLNGTYNSTLTGLARAGYRAPLSAEWSRIAAPTSVRLTSEHVATLDPITYPETDDLRTLDQGHGS